MTINDAINKAKENGYFWDSECEFACNESHLMNPEFWQALGKSMGWKTIADIERGYNIANRANTSFTPVRR